MYAFAREPEPCRGKKAPSAPIWCLVFCVSDSAPSIEHCPNVALAAPDAQWPPADISRIYICRYRQFQAEGTTTARKEQKPPLALYMPAHLNYS